MKKILISILPPSIADFLRFFNNGDHTAILSFLFDRTLGISWEEKLRLLKRMIKISNIVESPHTYNEVLSYIKTILKIPNTTPGAVVECGCFKGGSTAKFSLAAKLTNRKLIVFDSFEGIPKNNEPHEKNIFGGPIHFSEGDYCGKLEEVKGNVERVGEIASCEFVKGWFDDTLPSFNTPIAAAYIDVDLASSTKTCLKYLYPLLPPKGVIYSQDGHIPLVLDLLNDDSFWEHEIGVKKPQIEGFGKSKLIRIVKN